MDPNRTDDYVIIYGTKAEMERLRGNPPWYVRVWQWLRTRL